MPKYSVEGWVEYFFAIDVEADSEEEAEELVRAKDVKELAYDQHPVVEIDSIESEDRRQEFYNKLYAVLKLELHTPENSD